MVNIYCLPQGYWTKANKLKINHSQCSSTKASKQSQEEPRSADEANLAYVVTCFLAVKEKQMRKKGSPLGLSGSILIGWEHTCFLRRANMQRWEVKERLVNPKTIFRFPHVGWNSFCFAVIVPPARAGRDKMKLIWSFSSCSFKWLSNMVFLVRNSVSLILLTQTAEA